MASTFDALVAAETADLLAEFGEDVTYTVTATATSRTIKAVVLRETRQDELGSDFDNRYKTQRALISSRDDTEGVIAPAESKVSQAPDRVTIGGVVWYVWSVDVLANAGMHQLTLADGGG